MNVRIHISSNSSRTYSTYVQRRGNTNFNVCIELHTYVSQYHEQRNYTTPRITK